MMIRLSYRLGEVSEAIVKTLQLLGYLHTVVFVDMSVGFYDSLGQILFDSYRKHSEYLVNSKFVFLVKKVTDAECRTYLLDSQQQTRGGFSVHAHLVLVV